MYGNLFVSFLLFSIVLSVPLGEKRLADGLENEFNKQGRYDSEEEWFQNNDELGNIFLEEERELLFNFFLIMTTKKITLEWLQVNLKFFKHPL